MIYGGKSSFKNNIAALVPGLLLGKENHEKLEKNDFQKLFRLLDFHGLVPFFYEFNAYVQELTPDEPFKQNLKKKYLAVTTDNLHKMAVQEEIGNYLERKGIPFIFLKGLNLSMLLYQKNNIRPLLDIDLLVRPEDVKYPRDFMVEKGGVETKFLQNSFLQKFTPHERPILYKNVLIEIHTNILGCENNGHKNNQSPWFYQETYKSGDHVFNALKADYYIIYLCSHAYRHLITGKLKLLWFVDIAVFISMFYPDAKKSSELMDLAQKCNLGSEVEPVLFLVYKYLPGNELTTEVRSSYHQNNIENTFLKLCQATETKVKPEYYYNIFTSLATREKMLYAKGILFPSFNYLQEKFNVKNKLVCFFLLFLNPFRVLYKSIMYLFRGGF